jgi:hypothetical protein
MLEDKVKTVWATILTAIAHSCPEVGMEEGLIGAQETAHQGEEGPIFAWAAML